MTTTERYEAAKELYREIGVDTDAALETLKNIPVSLHCWQGDDVSGFDRRGPLTGGLRRSSWQTLMRCWHSPLGQQS